MPDLLELEPQPVMSTALQAAMPSLQDIQPFVPTVSASVGSSSSSSLVGLVAALIILGALAFVSQPAEPSKPLIQGKIRQLAISSALASAFFGGFLLMFALTKLSMISFLSPAYWLALAIAALGVAGSNVIYIRSLVATN